MRQQVFVIHGGTSFDSHEDYIRFLETREVSAERLKSGRSWRENLAEDLGDKFEVFTPKMPNGANARCAEWLIWFERCVDLLDDNVIFIGHSLGAIFLAKYLSENDCPKRIKATILVAAPVDDTDTVESLKDFKLPDSLERLAGQGGEIYIVHSKDDPLVPFNQTAKYLNLLPQAELVAFEDKGHFNQETFPELVNLIKGI